MADWDEPAEDDSTPNERAWMARARATLRAFAIADERAKKLEAALLDLSRPRPIADWTEADGPVLWWQFPVVEPPWAGTPLDDDWPVRHAADEWPEDGEGPAMEDIYTHWTPLPAPPSMP